MAFDFWILNFLQQFRSPFMDGFMILMTRLGDNGYIWIALTIVLLCFKKTRKLGVLMTIGLLIELFICNVGLKPLVHRTRPFDVVPFDVIIKRPTDYSFPSGHTGASFVCATILYRMKQKGWILALLLSILIAFSRLYLFVHYPTDVLGGMILGMCIGVFLVTIVEKKGFMEEKHE